MPTVSAVFETGSASRYLVQLLKHFAHKVPVAWTETEGRAELPGGPCTLTADESALSFSCEAASDEDVARQIHVIEAHLIRFAWREEVDLDWTDETGAPVIKPAALAAALAEERARLAAKRPH